MSAAPWEIVVLVAAGVDSNASCTSARGHSRVNEMVLRRIMSMRAGSISWILLSASTAMLVAVSIKYRALRADFLEHRRGDMRVQQGAYLPSFKGVSVAGDSLIIGELTHGYQILILLTAACPFSRESVPYWTRLAHLSKRSASDGEPQLVALTTDSMAVARAYAADHHLPFPLVPFPSRNLASLYRGTTVPQTIVIDSDGRVLFARHGVIDTILAVDSILAASTVAGPRSAESGPNDFAQYLGTAQVTDAPGNVP